MAGKERNFAINSTFASETIDNTHEMEQNSLSLIFNARTSIAVKRTTQVNYKVQKIRNTEEQ